MMKDLYDERMRTERNAAGSVAFHVTYVSGIVLLAAGMYGFGFDPILLAYGFLPIFAGGMVYVIQLWRTGVIAGWAEERDRSPVHRRRHLLRLAGATVLFGIGMFCFSYFFHEDSFGLSLLNAVVTASFWGGAMWWVSRTRAKKAESVQQ